MRWLRNLLAFVYWGSGLVTASFGWLIGAFACDESCGGPHWSDNSEAWQWDAIQTLALCVMALITFFLIATLVGRIGIAAFFYAVQVAAAGTILGFVVAANPGWTAPGIWLTVLAAEATGALAMLAGRGELEV
jgi:hypothetical protein